MSRIIKSISKLIAIVLIISIIVSAILIWYHTFDVIGLELYENERIEEIIPYYSSNYIITDEGYVYVMGYYNSESRKYRNSEFYHNDKLGSPIPVKMYDGKVTKIIPYDNLGALLINEKGELIDFNDFDIRKVYDGVSYSVKAPYKQGEKIFGGECEELFYIIDTNGTLLAFNSNGESKELIFDVCAVDYYNDTVIALLYNGDLNQYSISDDGKLLLEETLFKNVSSFDVWDTAVRYDGEKFVYDDEAAQKIPLVNVLTNDGELYAKGAYNLLCCTRSLSAYPEPKIIQEWTLIAEGVESFSMAPMGTAIKFMNGAAAYYGFDTDNSSNSKFEFGYLQLNVTNVVGVYAGDVQVLIKTKDAFYVWGFSLIYDAKSDNNNLFNGTPIKITL